MPHADILVAKQVWDATVKTVKEGKIVKEITKKGIRKNYFPKSAENKISHVRPHATNNDDTYELPVADKVTGATEYTKQSFWLNRSYVKDEIFLK